MLRNPIRCRGGLVWIEGRLGRRTGFRMSALLESEIHERGYGEQQEKSIRKRKRKSVSTSGCFIKHRSCSGGADYQRKYR